MFDFKEFDKAVRTYKQDVNQTLATLDELKRAAETYSKQLDNNDHQYSVIEEAQRRIANLKGKREDLKQDWAEASFEQDNMLLAELDGRKINLDEEMEELQDQINDAHARIETLDGDAIEQMLTRVNELAVPSTKVFADEYEQRVRDTINKSKSEITGMESWGRYYENDTVAVDHRNDKTYKYSPRFYAKQLEREEDRKRAAEYEQKLKNERAERERELAEVRAAKTREFEAANGIYELDSLPS